VTGDDEGLRTSDFGLRTSDSAKSDFGLSDSRTSLGFGALFALARRLWLVFHTVTMEMEPKGILYITVRPLSSLSLSRFQLPASASSFQHKLHNM